jgi:hypothetical protein
MDAVDEGDVYVIGRSYNGSNYDYRIVRLNSASSSWSLVWSGPLIYDIGSGPDYPAAIRVNPDVSGGVYLPDICVSGRNTGATENGPKYATLRYIQTDP